MKQLRFSVDKNHHGASNRAQGGTGCCALTALILLPSRASAASSSARSGVADG